MPAFQKYVFNSGATAFHGSIRKPTFQDLGNHLEVSTYAGSQANIQATNSRFAFDDVVSYESATTSIVARENGDYFEGETVARVTGLKIGGRLSIDEVTSRLRAVYDKRLYPQVMTARISPAGSTIKNLRIDGKPLDLKLPAAFASSDAEADVFLYRRDANTPAIAPDVRFIPAPFAIEDFGTIYYAEWTLEAQKEGKQHLTMVRFALGSDLGADGDAGCTYSNGTPWPPRT